MVEWNSEAVSTMALNKRRNVEHVVNWEILCDDVSRIDWTRFHGRADLVAGGPPCQPFSIGGKHRGAADERNMWPQVVRAVREISPATFLFENVRGLGRPAFALYLQWIMESLRRPFVERRPGETYERHLIRLRREKPEYDVLISRVNAADYGAPQQRHRIIIAGIARTREVQIKPPVPTHSAGRLHWDQKITGAYWARHQLRRGKPDTTNLGIAPPEHPWLTVRDAFVGLGPPNELANHVFQDGARIYIGHTGSLLDLPSKALKAGDHGVPGGENMMVRDDGTVRYFTVREAARLQGLPDDFQFDTVWSESMRQLGNAVPAQLGEALGRWLMETLKDQPIVTAA